MFEIKRTIKALIFLNGVSLLSGFLIQIVAISFEYDNYLISLNNVMIGIALASILDSFSLMRIEKIFSKKNDKSLKKIIQNIISWKILIFISIIFIIIFFPNKDISVIICTAISRHAYNFLKLGFAQLETKSIIFTISANSLIIRIVSNLLLMIIPFIAEQNNINLLIILVCLIEVLFIILIIMVNFDGLCFNIRVPLKYIKISLNKFIKSGLLFGLLNSIQGSIDRIILPFMVSDQIQVDYFKYKIVNQIIDGGYSLIGYPIHLNIIKTKRIPSLLILLKSSLYLLLLGFICFIYVFDVDSFTSFAIVCSLIFLVSFKRLIDGTFGSLLIAIKNYKLGIYKNIIEIFSLILGISCIIILSNEIRADYTYSISVIFGLSGSLFLLVTLRKFFNEKA